MICWVIDFKASLDSQSGNKHVTNADEKDQMIETTTQPVKNLTLNT